MEMFSVILAGSTSSSALSLLMYEPMELCSTSDNAGSACSATSEVTAGDAIAKERKVSTEIVKMNRAKDMLNINVQYVLLPNVFLCNGCLLCDMGGAGEISFLSVRMFVDMKNMRCCNPPYILNKSK